MSIEVGKTYQTENGRTMRIDAATSIGWQASPVGFPTVGVAYDGFGVPVDLQLFDAGWALVLDEPEDDGVSSPSHYTVGGFEALDVIKAKLTPEEYRGYLKGNILKYLMRANYKNDHDKDCKKAAYYGNKLEDSL